MQSMSKTQRIGMGANVKHLMNHTFGNEGINSVPLNPISQNTQMANSYKLDKFKEIQKLNCQNTFNGYSVINQKLSRDQFKTDIQCQEAQNHYQQE